MHKPADDCGPRRIPASKIGCKVAYVALGTARGHLMTAAVVRNLLRRAGYEVSVFTTSRDGQEFFATVAGQTPTLLRPGFDFEYDEAHSLQIGSSLRRIGCYALSPQVWHDVGVISRISTSHRLIVNDIHPAPMLWRWLTVRGETHPHLLNVVSEHSLNAVQDLACGWLPRFFDHPRKDLVQRLFTRRAYLIVTTLDPDKQFVRRSGITYLPQILDLPTISPAEVRSRLEVSAGQPLFVAYFNPLFRQQSLLTELVRIAEHHGAFLYVVSESLKMAAEVSTMNPVRVVPSDATFASALRAADLVISAAGVGVPLHAYAYGVPLVVLLTRQPEHVRNAATIVRTGMGLAAEEISQLARAVDRALAGGAQPHGGLLERTQAAWLSAIEEVAGA